MPSVGALVLSVGALLLCQYVSAVFFDNVVPEGGIPIWHLSMIQDEERNEAYYRALQKLIVPNQSTVLDVGSGTGLLSMFAASLGAKKVTAVELNVALSEVSREIMEINGFTEDDVDIINIHTKDLDIGYQGEHYLAPADVLVSETLDGWIIGEGFLDTLLDLRDRHLITNDTIVIPAHGTLYMQLIQSKYLFPTPEPLIRGFNFSPLQQHTYLDGITERLSEETAKTLSDPQPVLYFNFQEYGCNGHIPTPYTNIRIPVVQQGVLHGGVFWFHVCLDNDCEIRLSNSPDTMFSHWQQMFVHFEISNQLVQPGDTIHLLMAQISRRYAFAIATFQQRILRISSDCRGARLSVFREDATTGSSLSIFDLNDIGEFNLWVATVGEEYVIVASYYPNEDIASDEHELPPVREEELMRFTIPDRWPYTEVMTEDIPLYTYIASCNAP